MERDMEHTIIQDLSELTFKAGRYVSSPDSSSSSDTWQMIKRKDSRSSGTCKPFLKVDSYQEKETLPLIKRIVEHAIQTIDVRVPQASFCSS